MPNMPNFPMPLLTAAFVVFLIRANRRGSRAAPPSRLPLRLLGTSSGGLVLLVVGNFARQPVVDWLALSLLVSSLVLCGFLLRQGQRRPLQGITWALGADLLVLAAFLPFGIWIASLSLPIAAYNNPNEAEVRAALMRNPNDAAAHSSQAQLDEMRGDHTGEIAKWRQVLQVEPDNKDALIRLGGRLSQEKRIDEARPLFQKLAAANDVYSANARKWLARHGR